MDKANQSFTRDLKRRIELKEQLITLTKREIDSLRAILEACNKRVTNLQQNSNKV